MDSSRKTISHHCGLLHVPKLDTYEMGLCPLGGIDVLTKSEPGPYLKVLIWEHLQDNLITPLKSNDFEICKDCWYLEIIKKNIC